MTGRFPDADWVEGLHQKLNTDPQYARIASKWEGDFLFQIEPAGPLSERVLIYLDLWHGACREAYIVDENSFEIAPAFILESPYDNFVRVIQGKLDPMQAMLTRKLKVKGSMGYVMRNVPVVLDFVRCAKEVTTEVLE